MMAQHGIDSHGKVCFSSKTIIKTVFSNQTKDRFVVVFRSIHPRKHVRNRVESLVVGLRPCVG
jgi:hypothetical protein